MFFYRAAQQIIQNFSNSHGFASSTVAATFVNAFISLLVACPLWVQLVSSAVGRFTGVTVALKYLTEQQHLLEFFKEMIFIFLRFI